MKEQELFDWLKSEHYSDLEKSPETYDGFDCTSQEHKLFIELKSRHTHYDTLLLEKKKYDFLITTADSLDLEPCYINSTPSGIWKFFLSKLSNLVWEDKWLPVTTEFSNKSKITKQVTFLHIDSGEKIQ